MTLCWLQGMEGPGEWPHFKWNKPDSECQVLRVFFSYVEARVKKGEKEPHENRRESRRAVEGARRENGGEGGPEGGTDEVMSRSCADASHETQPHQERDSAHCVCMKKYGYLIPWHCIYMKWLIPHGH